MYSKLCAAVSERRKPTPKVLVPRRHASGCRRHQPELPVRVRAGADPGGAAAGRDAEAGRGPARAVSGQRAGSAPCGPLGAFFAWTSSENAAKYGSTSSTHINAATHADLA